ncbi:MAG: carboxypeptidase-like regulatory domain-containing protein, partial [Telluria sp.]
GLRIVPRPGKVSKLDFALSVTGEIDGTTFLLVNGARRPIGDLQLELVDTSRKVVANLKSSSDGYYVLPSVFPGTYLLRISPAQLKRLGLTDTGMHLVSIAPDGTILNARDFTVVADTQ